MAITFTEQHTLATDGEFINRARQAMLTVAFAVLQETPTTVVELAAYPSRQSLARRTLNNPQNVAATAAYALATQSNAADQSAINDTALQNFVANNWNVLAGYNPNYEEPGA